MTLVLPPKEGLFQPNQGFPLGSRYMGVEPKRGGFENPKMDGENNGKPYEQMG